MFTCQQTITQYMLHKRFRGVEREEEEEEEEAAKNKKRRIGKKIRKQQLCV